MEIFFLKLIILLFLGSNVEGYWVVQTQMGAYKGYEAPDGYYYQFLGIPYGKVNAMHPFADAYPFPPSATIYDARDDTHVCPQATIKADSSRVGFGTLDCLCLNVYVPFSVSKNKNLSVLVWLFGGRFSFGSASRNLYGPKHLVQHDVIVVSFNSRMGPHGYICLKTPEFPGNEGLKDQVLAFRWIKNNIAYFGGNADSITVMGESSGAKAADLHLYSKNENLFHRMILQGGSAFTMKPDLRRNEFENLKKMYMHLGVDANTTLEYVISLIWNDNPVTIATLADQLEADFSPCAERSDNNGINTFLTDNPINLKIPKVKNMSILIGYNADDQSHEYLLLKNQKVYENWDRIVERLTNFFQVNQNTLNEMIKLVIKFYIGKETVNYNNRFDIRKFDTDFKMAHPTQRAIDKYLKNGAAKIYHYVFSYVGGRNAKRGNEDRKEFGAVHSDEVGYLFDLPLFIGTGLPNAKDQLIINRMTTMWTNFAKHGNPTPQVSTDMDVVWEPITQNSPHYYLNIDSKMYLSTNPFHSRMAFWDLFYKVYGKFQKGLGNETTGQIDYNNFNNLFQNLGS